MKNDKSLIALILLLIAIHSFSTNTNAQVQFWSDDFEDLGSPSSGLRNPSVTLTCGVTPATAYFDRFTNADINIGTAYTGFSGSKFWAIEDIDKGPDCINNSVTAHQNITWTGINISGKTDLSFSGLFAVGTPTTFDGFGMVQSGGTSVFDYLIIEYSIDGGPFTEIIRFSPSLNNLGNGTLAVETTGDSIAEGEGPGLTTVATEYSGNIIGTGTTLDLKMKVWSNSAAEEILLDNFRLFESGLSPEIQISGNGTNIPDGNTSTSSADFTDLGSQDFCSGGIVKTFSIQNTGMADLNIGTPQISGLNAGDFSITSNPSSTVVSSGFTSFEVTFDPTAAGLRTATITIPNTDADESIFDFVVQGTGIDGTPSITGSTPASRCDAGTVDLMASASAGTLNWYDAPNAGNFIGTGSPLTTPSISVSITYYVDATVGSCTSPRTAVTATVNITPTPDAPADVIACDSYTLPALTVGNYYTVSGAGGVQLNAEIILLLSTNLFVYAETGTVPNCSSENSFTITINDCAELNEQAISKIQLFPNPAVDVVTIQNLNLNTDREIVLEDLQGKKIAKWKIDEATEQIQVDELAAGSYLIRIIGTDIQRVKSIHIVH